MDDRASGIESPRRSGRALRRTALALLAASAGAGALPGLPPRDARAEGVPLSTAEVTELVSRCVFYAERLGTAPVSIAVVDVEGNSLGVFHMTGSAGCRAVALAKAATGAYFSSDEGSFSTRTATFIIQDHFPPGLLFSPAGPLYGVEFSGFGTSDVNPIYFPRPQDVPPGTCFNQPSDPDVAPLPDYFVPLPEGVQARVRGELGGVALFRDGLRVGGLGLDAGGFAADGSVRDDRVTVPSSGLALNPSGPYSITFSNLRRGRDLERIVVASAAEFLPPKHKRATRINLDGFRLPFVATSGFSRRAVPPVVPGVDGDFDLDYPLRDASTIPSRFVPLVLAPPPSAPAGAASFSGSRPAAFAIQAGTDGFLTAADVARILWQGGRAANVTRAAIRRPIGLPMQCFVSVVDTNGEVLGVYRTPDATLFSYDVSVQKARTAALFSDAQAAWSCRAVGEVSQGFYPPGQQQEGRPGPLFQLQDGLSVALLTGGLGPAPSPRIRNGIAIFPGGVPLYQGGTLVGGIGVSGDGVDQDDLVADASADGFQAPAALRVDRLGVAARRASLGRTLDRIEAFDPGSLLPDEPEDATRRFFVARLGVARRRVGRIDVDLDLPWVKLPRHPGPVTIR